MFGQNEYQFFICRSALDFYPSIFYMSSEVMVFKSNVLFSGREILSSRYFNIELVILVDLAKKNYFEIY